MENKKIVTVEKALENLGNLSMAYIKARLAEKDPELNELILEKYKLVAENFEQIYKYRGTDKMAIEMSAGRYIIAE